MDTIRLPVRKNQPRSSTNRHIAIRLASITSRLEAITIRPEAIATGYIEIVYFRLDVKGLHLLQSQSRLAGPWQGLWPSAPGNICLALMRISVETVSRTNCSLSLSHISLPKCKPGHQGLVED